MTALLLKVTLVLTIGLIASALTPRLFAARRHLLILASIVAALLLPALHRVVPRVDLTLPWLPQRAIVSEQRPAATRDIVTSVRSSVAEPTASTPSERVSAPSHVNPPAVHSAGITLPQFLLWAWMLGACGVLAWIVAGRIRLGQLRRRALPVTDATWRELLDAECGRVGLTQPVNLLTSEAASCPVTWGITAPIILLPTSALALPADQRVVVLRHELAHIARGDVLAQLVAGLTCASYWFHPLTWFAARRLRIECERACDERVLASGVASTQYAAYLVQVAREIRAAGQSHFLSLAMVRRSELETRVHSVLEGFATDGRLTPGSRAASTLFVVVVALTVSAFRVVSPLPKLPAVWTTIVDLPSTPTALTNVAQPATAAPVAIDSEPARAEVAAPQLPSLTLTDIRVPAAPSIVAPKVHDVCVEQLSQIKTDVGFLGDRLGLARYFGERGIQRESPGHETTRIPRAPAGARVTQASGSIWIGESAGDVYALTGGGSIDITASGHVVATTGGGGTIAVTFEGGGAHNGEIGGWGDVTLTLPDGLSAVIVVEAAYTRRFGGETDIVSDWPLNKCQSLTPIVADWDSRSPEPRRNVQSRLVLGSGEGRIRVRTINGNVRLLRASGATE